jgi:predicted DNA-binding transcriptional regulator AlpA
MLRMAVRKTTKEARQIFPDTTTVVSVARLVEPKNLVGAAEIAERLGVARPQLVHDWARRYADFPAPIAQLRQAMIWDWREVDKWAKENDMPKRRRA